jgi:hypothetical protein
MLHISPPTPRSVIAINVDYAATGHGHLDRAPCRVTIVKGGELIMDLLIKVDPLYSAMSSYTGVSADDIAAGVTMDVAVAQVHAACIGDALFVGHSLARICSLFKLPHESHYVDVTELTRTWNRRFEHWNFYSLAKICYAVFGDAVQPIDSIERAVKLFAIYSFAFSDEFALAALKGRLQKLQYGKQFPASVTSKPAITDVCVWAYNAEECTCDQPSLRGGADSRALKFPGRIRADVPSVAPGPA